jgi:hypothetical protein
MLNLCHTPFHLIHHAFILETLGPVIPYEFQRAGLLRVSDSAESLQCLGYRAKELGHRFRELHSQVDVINNQAVSWDRTRADVTLEGHQGDVGFTAGSTSLVRF